MGWSGYSGLAWDVDDPKDYTKDFFCFSGIVPVPKTDLSVGTTLCTSSDQGWRSPGEGYAPVPGAYSVTTSAPEEGIGVRSGWSYYFLLWRQAGTGEAIAQRISNSVTSTKEFLIDAMRSLEDSDC